MARKTDETRHERKATARKSTARKSTAKAATRKTATRRRPSAEPQLPAAGDRGHEQGGVGRRTVSMPQEVIAGVDERVGAREFSGYVTAAVRRQLQRDEIKEFLAAADELDGPISEDVRSEVAEALRSALAAAAG